MDVNASELLAAKNTLRQAFPDANLISVDMEFDTFRSRRCELVWSIYLGFSTRKPILESARELTKCITLVMAHKVTVVDAFMAEAHQDHQQNLHIEALNRDLAARPGTWAK